MMVDTVKIRGLKELNNELKRFPVKIQKTAIRKGVRAGARLIQQKAKTLVPVKSGATRRAISVGANNSRGEPNIIRASVYVKTGGRRTRAQKRKNEDPYWWYFQERGYRAVGRKKFTGSGRAARQRYRAGGSLKAGKKFMERAFESRYGRALVTFRKTLGQEVNKYRVG